MHSTRIGPEFFDCSHDVSEEGTASPISLDQHPEGVDRATLQQKLQYVVSCIAPGPRALHRWDERIHDALTEVLGEAAWYPTTVARDGLREKSRRQTLSTVEMLVERTLWLTSFDGVDPIAVGDLHLLDMFRGLHIDEPSIQPRLRWGGGTHHASMRIYLGPDKFVRMHIYPDGPPPERVNCVDLAHEHDGASAGIILTGELVNQHFDLPHAGEDGSHPLYILRNSAHHANLGQAGRVNRVFTRIGSTNPQRVCSRAYGLGDMYSFNGSTMRELDRFPVPYATMPSDFRGSHNVATRGLTVTFFTNHTPERAPDTYALLPAGTPDHFEASYNSDARTLSPQDAETLVRAVSEAVEADLGRRSSVHASTYLDRAPRDRAAFVRARFQTLRGRGGAPS